MSKPNWNDKRKRWELNLYENRKRIHTFTSSKPGKAGYNACLAKRSEWLSGAKDNHTTVNAQWERFFEDVSRRYAPEGAANLQSNYNNYIKPILGNRKLTGVTTNEWQSCLNKARKRDGSPLSEKTVKSIRNTISEFFKFCRKDGLTMPSSTDLYIPKSVKPVKEKAILTEEHMALIFDDSQSFSNLFYMPLFRFALSTGMRPGEIIGLTYADYDGTFCSIKRSINTHKNIRQGGKTKNAARKIALSTLAKQAIDKQIDQTKELKSKYIFCNPTGEIASSAKINRSFKELCQKIGAPSDITLYSCRHTFISYASRVLPESALKPLVGHSVAMTTLKTYQHTTDQMLKDAAASFDQITFNSDK